MWRGWACCVWGFQLQGYFQYDGHLDLEIYWIFFYDLWYFHFDLIAFHVFFLLFLQQLTKKRICTKEDEIFKSWARWINKVKNENHVRHYLINIWKIISEIDDHLLKSWACRISQTIILRRIRVTQVGRPRQRKSWKKERFPLCEYGVVLKYLLKLSLRSSSI